MREDDPRHGQYKGWQQHHRDGEKPCGPCADARRTYQRKRERNQILGVPARVSIAKVRRHLFALERAGVTNYDIATRAGVSYSTIIDTKAGKRPRMLKSTADALLAVRPDPSPNVLVDSTGTIRRVQAMQYNGWSFTQIANQATILGYPMLDHTLRQLMGAKPRPVCKFKTAQAVRAAFSALEWKQAPRNRASSTVRVRALMKGYVSALAWDDIDDPTEIPMVRHAADRHRPKHEYDEAVVLRRLKGDKVPTTLAERVEICRRARDLGWSYHKITTITGIDKIERYLGVQEAS